MEGGFRAFVAVHVGPLPGLVALIDGLRATGADLKLVEPENLHLTLKFLGDTPESRVPVVAEAMREAAAPEAPFEARLEGAGSFGPRAAPRVVWVGMQGAEALARVAERLDGALAARGVAEPERRPFKSHVTLARSRSERGGAAVAAFVRAHERADAGSLAVRELRLMRSTLTPHGPRYDVVQATPLGGA